MDFLLSDSRNALAKPPSLTLLAFVFWVVLAGSMLLHAVLHPEDVFYSTDDAMRLTEVRDLLAGQSWFDNTQYRMNTPFGLPMHWSRLVDGGVAALILFFRLFLDPKNAELGAIYLWPVLWLLPCFIAIARIGVRLGGYAIGVAALLLAVNCANVFGYFQPGTVDQDNVHMAITLWGVVFLLELELYPGAAMGLGIILAVNLAIGLETLPFVLTISAVAAYFWIAKGGAMAARVRNFGLVFAAMAAVLLLGATATIERLGTACDTYSALFGVLAIAGGAGLAALTLIPALNASLSRRMISILALGLALFALTLVTAPDCLYGPYAHVDPKLDRIWLSRIEEVLSPLATMGNEPGTFFSNYFYALIGFAASIAAAFLVERERRTPAIIMCVFAGLALAITTAEVRGMPFAIWFALPGMAATIMRLVVKYARSMAMAAAATIVALALFSNITFDIAGRYLIEGEVHAEKRIKTRDNAIECLEASAVTQLATLPRGRVAAMVDQGPIILMDSGHAVIGGPYHRNVRGIIDSYDLFTAKPEVGARILQERGIDYVMTCRSSPDYSFYLKQGGKDSLLSQIDQSRDPAWLARVKKSDPKQDVQIYRVLKDKLPI